MEHVLSGRSRGLERLLLVVGLTMGLMPPAARAQEAEEQDAGVQDPLERFRAVMEDAYCGEWNMRPHRCEAKACAQARQDGADPGAVALELAECWSKAEPKHKSRASMALHLMAEFGNEAQRQVAYVRLAARGARTEPSSFSRISCDMYFATAPACKQTLWGCTSQAAGCSGSNSCGSGTSLYLSKDARQAFAASTGWRNPETVELRLQENETCKCNWVCQPSIELGGRNAFERCVRECQERKECLLREVDCTLVFLDPCNGRAGLSCTSRERRQEPVREVREVQLPR